MTTILVDAAHTFVIPNQGIDKEMFALLERYPQRKLIVSNANNDELITFGLAHLPYKLFSLEHKPNKTNPLYFQVLCERQTFAPKEAIYFDHNPDAVRVAQSLGIISYHFDHTKRDLKALEQFLNTHLRSPD